MKYLSLIALLITSTALCFGQTPSATPSSSIAPEKPRMKNFGSSLKNDKNKKGAAKGNAKSTQSKDADIIRVETELVVNDVLVVNPKGNIVLGLKKEDFIVSEDEIPQDIAIFAFGENAAVPRSIVLIIDNHSSLVPYIKNSIQAAKHLVDKLAPQDRMAIVTDHVKLLADFTKDKNLLKNTLDSLERVKAKDGNGLEFDTLLAVLNEMFSKEDIRPMVILQSDGSQTAMLKADKNNIPYPEDIRAKYTGMYGVSRFGFNDVKETVEKSRATVYSIIPGARIIGFSKEEQLKRAATYLERQLREVRKWKSESRISAHVNKFKSMELAEILPCQTTMFELAELAGGYTDYIEQPEDAENVYSTLFSVISNRYMIGYYATDSKPGTSRHNVNISIKNHPEYIVTRRKTYVTPDLEE